MNRIVTFSELQHLPLSQLQALRNEAEQALGRSAPGSAERRQAAASLDAIQRTIRLRGNAPRPGF